MQNFDESSQEIIEQLKQISEQLGDQALTLLKQAHFSGETKRPEDERRLTQARRAVEKAISLLTRD